MNARSGAPTVVFEETFSRGGLLASYWPVAEGEIEINSFGGFPYDFVLFLIEENLLESAEMDLSGRVRGDAADGDRPGGRQRDDGHRFLGWESLALKLRTESLVNFVPGTLANPRVIDLPSDALHSAFKIRIHGPQSQYRWRLDDIVVSRIDDDCNGNGRIDTCDASEAAHDCNNNAALDVCDIDQARVGHRQDYDLGVWPDSIALGDFDNDGDNDLAVGRGPFYSGGYVRLMINDGFGMFQVAEELAAGVWPRAIVAGDIDNDADIDLVAAAGNLQLLRNYGGIWWGFAPGVGLATPGIDLVAQDVALGDVDQDGDLDLVATFGTLGAGSPQFAVLLNDGAGQFTLVHSYELPGEAARSVVLFDADHDGDLDAAATIQLYSDGVIVLPNLGSAAGPVARVRRENALRRQRSVGHSRSTLRLGTWIGTGLWTLRLRIRWEAWMARPDPSACCGTPVQTPADGWASNPSMKSASTWGRRLSLWATSTETAGWTPRRRSANAVNWAS